MRASHRRDEHRSRRSSTRSRTDGRCRRAGTSIPVVHERERERIFARAWTYAGPAEWVAEPGSYFAAQIGHVPVAVVRGSDGIAARAGQRLPAPTATSSSTAPAAARRSSARTTRGRTTSTARFDERPRSEREPGFDPSGLSLAPVSVDTWGPFVFVNADPDAPPLAGGARRPARDRRRERARRRRHPLPLAPRVADRGELEGRHGELPRVLPLPDRASRLQQGHRRRPRLRIALQVHRDLLESDRPGSRIRARRATARRPTTPRGERHAVAVPLPLPDDDAEHRAGHPEHLAGALPP